MNPLAQHWLFRELDQAELARVDATVQHLRVPGGFRLFAKGDPTPGFHMLLDGAVKIFVLTEDGEEHIRDIFGPGGVFGEMGVVDRAPSSAWGETMGPAEMLVIPAADFERLLLSQPALCLKVARVLAGKLRSTADKVDETLYLSARIRVLRHLVRLTERHGQPVANGVLVSVRITHQEIAAMAGTARETVSRVLAELQDRGVLRFAGRLMLFTDPPGLRTLAGLPNTP